MTSDAAIVSAALRTREIEPAISGIAEAKTAGRRTPRRRPYSIPAGDETLEPRHRWSPSLGGPGALARRLSHRSSHHPLRRPGSRAHPRRGCGKRPYGPWLRACAATQGEAGNDFPRPELPVQRKGTPLPLPTISTRAPGPASAGFFFGAQDPRRSLRCEALRCPKWLDRGRAVDGGGFAATRDPLGMGGWTY
jgi:hypothetical protein